MAAYNSVNGFALAVRAIVELFRLVKREKELNREILTFSISFRIYGRYAVIEEKKTALYRHPLHEF